jgi:predicted ATPase/signal transduction histidine kinase
MTPIVEFPIAGYHITEQLYEGVMATLYRGYRHHDRTPVLIQILQPTYCAGQSIEQLQQAAELLRQVAIPGTTNVIDMVPQLETPVWILEDIGGQPWTAQLTANQALTATQQSETDATEQQPTALLAIVDVAIQVVEILMRLHAHRLIHQQIQPEHILVNPITGQVQLWLPMLEPGVATGFSVGSSHIGYMSPEQTGRLNQQIIDYRSDFYSLGVTLYQACVGCLPFPSGDLNELVHAHIACVAIAPHNRNAAIPLILSELILKLLNKNPAARYQSGFGLRFDLQLCRQVLESGAHPHPLRLGTRDISSQLRLSKRLYGREAELATLHQAYAEACRGQRQVVQLEGESGIGKSLLLHTFQQGIADRSGYCLTGRYDQNRQEVPYLALIQAFQSLIQQWLSQDEAQIQVWRQRLGAALGANAAVLISVLPELGLLLEPPAAATAIGKHQLPQALQALIQLLAQTESPLVLILEHWHWADLASLQLIEQIVATNPAQGLLLIVTVRPDAIADRASNTALDAVPHDPIKALGSETRSIQLTAFDEALMAQLIADTLQVEHGSSVNTNSENDIRNNHQNSSIDASININSNVEYNGSNSDNHQPQPSSSPQSIATLAQLIGHRTQGNPFFAHQLLLFLAEQNWLVFDFEQGYWQWDLAQIQQMGVTDTVVTLMTQKLDQLSAPTQQVLKIAACLGQTFKATMIANLIGQSIEQALPHLQEAMRQGIILLVNHPESHNSLASLAATSSESAPPDFQFLHGRLRQAAYELMSEAERQQCHLQIGQESLRQMREHHRDDRLFEVVNQLNLGQALLTDPGERQHLAQLNFDAGKKAKQGAAYHSALNYFLSSSALLPADSWTIAAQFTRQLWLEQAECQYLCGNFTAAEIAFATIHSQTHTTLEAADVYVVQMACYINQNRHREAAQIGQISLDNLGIVMPATITSAMIAQQLEALKQHLRSPAYVMVLPTSEEPEHQQRMKLLRYFAAATIVDDRRRYSWAIMQMVAQSLRSGNTAESAYAYVAFGTILCRDFGEFEIGHQLGQVALEVSDSFQTLQGITHFSYGGLLAHWRIDLAECRQHLSTAFQYCTDSGELLYALFSEALNTDLGILRGVELEQAAIEIAKFADFASQRRHPSMQLDAQVKQQLVRSLQGQTEDAASFSSIDCPETVLWEKLTATNIPTATRSRYFIYKAMSLYLFGYYHQAATTLEQSAAIVDCHFGPAIATEHYFYQALTLAALYGEAEPTLQTVYLNEFDQHLQRFQTWHKHCPANFAARYHLLNAERLRMIGQDPTGYYDETIEVAQQYGLIHLVGLANELAGQYYWRLDCQRIAYAYINDACIAYRHWGATAKVTAMQQQYRTLLLRRSQMSSSHRWGLMENWAQAEQSRRDRIPDLDWLTILKSSQALSGEIVYDRLLEKLLTIVIENAGAQRGVLLARSGPTLIIEAEGQVREGQKISADVSGTTATATNLPLNLITYVERTNETMLLNQAIAEPRFAHDPYIQQRQLQSILCLPIMHQGQPLGILYLENGLVAGAFTSAQLEVLKLLTAQVAISMANARLYRDLQSHVTTVEANNVALQQSQTQLTQRTAQLETTLQDLQATQAQLVQTEKLSSLGQMVAGVAHEVKNPLNFILGNLSYAHQYTAQLFMLLQHYQTAYPEPNATVDTALSTIDLTFVQDDLPKILNSMEMGAERIQKIVASLQNFSRIDTTEKEWTNIHDGIEGTLLILQPKLRATVDRSAIALIKQYGELPPVRCFGGQINQVVMNIVANAIDAINDLAQTRCFEDNQDFAIVITTEIIDQDWIAITIIDNGPGLQPEIQAKIFEPFFTTKEVGVGTGLGLSISHQIITENHHGEISCQSHDNTGLIFTIRLPIQSTHDTTTATTAIP